MKPDSDYLYSRLIVRLSQGLWSDGRSRHPGYGLALDPYVLACVIVYAGSCMALFTPLMCVALWLEGYRMLPLVLSPFALLASIPAMLIVTAAFVLFNPKRLLRHANRAIMYHGRMHANAIRALEHASDSASSDALDALKSEVESCRRSLLYYSSVARKAKKRLGMKPPSVLPSVIA